MKKLFALVDCNSFFCSCEQVFAPQLRKKPVVVLSNNDGVIVARSAEAKLAGIRMGEPYYQAKAQIKNKNIHVFSSNYSLYGDMSDRIMAILQQLGLDVEIYSIDEAFLNYEFIPKANRLSFAENIRSKILKYTGIPVSVGIGPTKVLAKVANEIAKKSVSNVCDLSLREDYNAALTNFPVDDIWGIGRQSAIKLRAHGINTAMDLQKTALDKVEKLLTVTGRRIALELDGISCLGLDVMFVPRKQIVSSKSFGKKVFTITELSEACSSYLTKACEKLRSQNSVCSEVKVFVCSNQFKSVDQYFNSGAVRLAEPTASTIILNRAALKILQNIYKPNIEYKKVGVMLGQLISADAFTPDLFTNLVSKAADQRLMSTVDNINRRFGSSSVQLGSCGLKKEWRMANKLCSPRYTTHWDELLEVKAS